MNKITKLFAAAIVCSVGFGIAACDKTPETPLEDGPLKISVETLDFSGGGATKSIIVEGINWDATPSDEWIEVQMDDTDELKVIVGANPSITDPRDGSITIKNGSDEKKVTVTQVKRGTPDMTVSETRLEFPHLGATKTVTVTAEREWTATPSAEWIGISPSADGTSFDVILGSSADVPATTPIELNGTILVSNGVASQNKTIAVWQALGLQSLIVYPHNAKLLFPNGTMQLEAMLGPANATNKNIVWESLDTSIVTVDDLGNIRAIAPGQTTVTLTSEDVGPDGQPLMDDCLVVVSEPWTPGTVRFRSETTWTVGNQIWSDVVMSSNAEKDDFVGISGNTYIPDACQNGNYGHMFSWTAVNQFADQLCPAPWRMPTGKRTAVPDPDDLDGDGQLTEFENEGDYVVLDKALGGTGENTQTQLDREDRYRNEWGLEWAGQAFKNNLSGSGPNNRAAGAGYWTKSGHDGPSGYAMHIVDNSELGGQPHPSISPVTIQLKEYGYLVRCVKDVE